MHAVDQLLKVRQGSVELRRKLAEVNDALQSRGTRWAQKVSAIAVCMMQNSDCHRVETRTDKCEKSATKCRRRN